MSAKLAPFGMVNGGEGLACVAVAHVLQSNVAMAVAVDVHEHGRTDKKRVFVDSRILSLRYTG